MVSKRSRVSSSQASRISAASESPAASNWLRRTASTSRSSGSASSWVRASRTVQPSRRAARRHASGSGTERTISSSFRSRTISSRSIWALNGLSSSLTRSSSSSSKRAQRSPELEATPHIRNEVSVRQPVSGSGKRMTASLADDLRYGMHRQASALLVLRKRPRCPVPAVA